jgi:hypothetical protein
VREDDEIEEGGDDEGGAMRGCWLNIIEYMKVFIMSSIFLATTLPFRSFICIC